MLRFKLRRRDGDLPVIDAHAGAQAGRTKPVGSCEAGMQNGDALEGNPRRAARSQKRA